MTRLRLGKGLFGAVVAGLLVLPALAQQTEAAGKDANDTVTRLERLLAQQQDRIDSLEREVASANAQDTDEQRAQMMRDQIRAVLSDSQFRESLMPAMAQAGYDKGFYIRSTDEKFKLMINGYMQFRWTHYNTRTENRYLNPGPRRGDRTGFDAQRVRLTFTGNMWTKDLTYYIELMADAPNNYDVGILWAWVNYQFCEAFNIKAGIFSIPSTRSEGMDQRGYLFVDHPMFNSVFGLGDGTGVQFWGKFFDGKLVYMLSLTNSLNNSTNRTISNDPREHDNSPAVTFRVIWHAMGDDPAEWNSESDINHLDSPALDIGFHYAFNEDQGDLGTTRIPFARPDRWRGGGFGLTTTNGMQINQFGIDAAFKYMGFSAIGEYVVRIADPRRAGRRPFTPWWLLSGDDSTTAQHGAYVQLGYFLPIPGLEDKLEIAGRVGGISALGDDQEGTWEYGCGINYYLNGAEAGNMTKLQFDITKVSEVPTTDSYASLANVNDDALVFRVQLQVGF